MIDSLIVIMKNGGILLIRFLSTATVETND